MCGSGDSFSPALSKGQLSATFPFVFFLGYHRGLKGGPCVRGCICVPHEATNPCQKNPSLVTLVDKASCFVSCPHLSLPSNSPYVPPSTTPFPWTLTELPCWIPDLPLCGLSFLLLHVYMYVLVCFSQISFR